MNRPDVSKEVSVGGKKEAKVRISVQIVATI